MIIGFSGLAGAGKDTVADLLVKHYKFTKVALADPLKRICKDVFQFTDEQLWGPSEKRNEPDVRYPRDGGYLTPRYALQQLGTEWGRDCYNNVWVDYALRTADKILKPAPWDGTYSNYSQPKGLYSYLEGSDRYKGVAIPDVRFKNEVDAIKKAGGFVVRLTRPSTTLTGEAAQHASEQEQLEIPDSEFHFLIPNHGVNQSCTST
jgi:hypothetical protein